MKILKIILTSGLLTLSANLRAQPLQPLIVGGTEAAKGEFPFIVSFQSNSYGHFCGGSLIKADWVLTAGHCAIPSYMDSIVIGLHDQNDKSNTEVFKVKKMVVHPQFNSNALDYDFALIQLDRKSSFPPVSLNGKEVSIPATGEPLMSITAGWGALTESSYALSSTLQKVSVPLVPEKTCADAYKDFNTVTDRMICAGYQEGGKDACQGDSGGPLLVKKGNAFSLIGVVSWGQGCARPIYYGVYSKVNSVYSWIQQTIR